MNKFTKVLVSKTTYSLGIAVGLVTYLLSLLLNVLRNLGLGIPDTVRIGGSPVSVGALSINLGEQVSSSGVASPLGVKTMSLLISATNFSLLNLFTVIIGSIIVVMLGRLIYSIKFVPHGSQKVRLAVELFYGALASMVIIGGLAGVGLSAVITLAIYYVIVAFIVNLAAKNLRFFAKLVRS